MNIFKKILCGILSAAALSSALPAAYAENENIYSITNGYLSYSFNAKTGGFSIETDEGNPKKQLDNKIPLLYKEDGSQSGGTSFTSVRIGKKDYVFGQDYGFFGSASKLDAPEISSGGRLMTTKWTINNIEIIQKVALGQDANTDTIGNTGISYEVVNNSGKEETVGIRLMLDTALGNDIDAPYVAVDNSITPVLVETEFTGEELPQQVRNLDSLTNPTKLSYLILKGWNGGIAPNRLTVGHWANLANTKYDYTPDKYCDFTNYSNKHRTPDSAAAIYWDNQTVAPGESVTVEALYGIGNFSEDKSTDSIGIDISAGRIELADDKKSYKNNGETEITVNIDNTYDSSVELGATVLQLTVDSEALEIVGSDKYSYNKLGKEIRTCTFTVRAKPQAEITAGTVYAALTTTRTDSTGNGETLETAAQRSIILPSVNGSLAAVQMTKVNPETVWTGGEKAVTITGNMKAFQALSGNQGWKAELVHTSSDHRVEIEKKNIAFIDKDYKNLSFMTDEELIVGEYKIVFNFDDKDLKEAFGQSITAAATLKVSADEKYRLKSYGIAALVRSTDFSVGSAYSEYNYFVFADEGEYRKFYDGELEKTAGVTTSTSGIPKTLKYAFGKDNNAIAENEILLVIRANLRETELEEADGTKRKYYRAEKADGDIIINNMLSYEGTKPLTLSAQNGHFDVKGDGVLKVVNSITVWRSAWSFSGSNGGVLTLDTKRFDKCRTNVQSNKLKLTLDGAASMIQSIGGLLVGLKYGEMSSEWHEEAKGQVTYGIGFGGKLSLPIKAKEKKETEAVLTADQEDVSDSMNSLFAEPDEPDTGKIDKNEGKKEKQKETLALETTMSEGRLSISADNVLFGEKPKTGSDGKVITEDNNIKINDTGFVGINTTASLALPKDLLGDLVTNMPGIYASVTINTIDNIYTVGAGVALKIIECEGLLSFKETTIKNKQAIVPDAIKFSINDGLMIPIAPPVLYMTGLGGGIEGLADTIGGEFDKLPPITILLSTRLMAINTLVGDFKAKINLTGLSLDGTMKLKYAESIATVEAGISARWIDPWELNLYGKISILMGVLQGGLTVNVADNYFYGYVYASLCIPNSIPLVGGKELGGVEAAVSHKFIGGNIKIIGIKFGFIYYWGGDFSFGRNIDLSAPPKNNISGQSAQNMRELEESNSDGAGYYGTNIYPIKTQAVDNSRAISLFAADDYKDITVKAENAEGSNALLFEIPYTGMGDPQIGDFILKNPQQNTAVLQPDDGMGGGSFIVQDMGENGKSIFITVTDKSLIKNGDWTLRYKTQNINITDFTMCRVDDIPELTVFNASYDGKKLNADWQMSSRSDTLGTLDVYLTEDKDILEKLKTENNTGLSIGTNVLHEENVKANDSRRSFELPKTLDNGNYYTVISYKTSDGISNRITDTPFEFVNPNLPKPVKEVKVKYGGNGNLYVEIEDADDPDYTNYIVEIEDMDNTALENNMSWFEKGDKSIFIGKEAKLVPGKNYRVNVKTLRVEENQPAPGSNENPTTSYYYGSDIVSTDGTFVMPSPVKPKLLKVKADFDKNAEYINKDSIELNYTFENDVFAELTVNGQRLYSDNKFKKDWKFKIENLEDGDYIVDIKAFSLSKDYADGKELSADNPDAQLAFTVDTSAPALSLAKKNAQSMDENTIAVFGSNTVIANDDGSYEFEGMTDAGAELSVEPPDGIRIVNSNGTFKVTGTVPDNSSIITETIKSADKAGNTSELTVTIVGSEYGSFERIELMADGKAISENINGEKRITLKNGADTKLSVTGIKADGRSFEILDDTIEWKLLYDKNAVTFKDGSVTAVMPGETAVKAKLNTAEVQNENGLLSYLGLEDYVLLTIEENSKADLKEAIDKAEKLLSDNPKASAKNALRSAIDKANTVYKNSKASDNEISEQVTALNKAMDTFKDSLDKGGDLNPSSGSSNITVGSFYKLTLLPTENGKATLSHTKVRYGTSVTITAKPEEGYVVADMLINGKSVGKAEIYTINAVTEDTVVEVKFKVKPRIPFEDVSENDWFYDDVCYVYDNGLFNGVSETLFAPNDKLTRGMVVTVLYRQEGSPDMSGTACGFEDVEENTYYHDAVAWAAQNGIVKGYSEKEFAPNDNITREQLAAIMYRFAGFKGEDTGLYKDLEIDSYTDKAEISDYAHEAFKWAVGSKLINGRTETTLNPKDNTTRAEAAAILQRYLTK